MRKANRTSVIITETSKALLQLAMNKETKKVLIKGLVYCKNEVAAFAHRNSFLVKSITIVTVAAYANFGLTNKILRCCDKNAI